MVPTPHIRSVLKGAMRGDLAVPGSSRAWRSVLCAQPRRTERRSATRSERQSASIGRAPGARQRRRGALAPTSCSTPDAFALATPSLLLQRSGFAAVVVVQTAEYGECDDLPRLWPLPFKRYGDILGNALMRPRAIEKTEYSAIT